MPVLTTWGVLPYYFRNGSRDLNVGDQVSFIFNLRFFRLKKSLNHSTHLLPLQVFLDYQVEDDEDLVAAYGFSLKHRKPEV